MSMTPQDIKTTAAPNPPTSKQPASPPKPPQLKAVDREFLPAALEILVTPPSPIARTLLLYHLRDVPLGAGVVLFRLDRHPRRRTGQDPAERSFESGAAPRGRAGSSLFASRTGAA